jgi:hypothetical protein
MELLAENADEDGNCDWDQRRPLVFRPGVSTPPGRLASWHTSGPRVPGEKGVAKSSVNGCTGASSGRTSDEVKFCPTHRPRRLPTTKQFSSWQRRKPRRPYPWRNVGHWTYTHILPLVYQIAVEQFVSFNMFMVEESGMCRVSMRRMAGGTHPSL